MDYTFAEAVQRLERVAKTNKAQSTRDTKTTRSSFSMSTNTDQAKKNQEMLQELVWISTNVSLLMKQNQEWVNAVSQQAKAPKL